MRSLIRNGRIWTGAGWLDDHAVLIDGSRIEAVMPEPVTSIDALVFDLDGASLAPGCIDIQVNGGGGVLFNDTPDIETIRRIGAAHRKFGTTGFFPTLISDNTDKMAVAAHAVARAIATGIPGVLGVHFEGPFLSVEKKGVHDPAHFRTLSEDHLTTLTRLEHGATLVTLAPERASADLLQHLASSGVILSAGHTNASAARMQVALDSGVTGFTHLYNAMSSLTSREPGVVGCALASPDSWCSLIIDGKHVARENLAIALACKGEDKLILITDAMPTVGMTHEADEAAFDLGERRIEVRDGVCVAPDGTLAGSNLDMASAVRNAVSFLKLELGAALNMASLNPARFMRLDGELGRIEPGYRASLIAFDGQLQVLNTWIDGQRNNHPDHQQSP